MESPEIHTPHTGHGGIRWLEIAASVSALVVSFASIFIAVQHGKTMEKLVTANSMPYLDAQFSSATEDGQLRMSVDLTNEGVGPAHVVSLKVSVNGRSRRNFNDLVVGAFGPEHAAEARHNLFVVTNNTRTRFIPARQKQFIYFVKKTPENAKVWSALREATQGMRIETCYCSVFNECWTRIADEEPKPVKQCVRDEPREFNP
jgi:hypothetical protein